MTARTEALSPIAVDAPLERRLPSGRSMVVRMDGAGEQIEIRSPKGELDLRIVLTDAGPVVTLRAARLEVDSDEVAFRCRTFDVQATEARIVTEGDIHLNGAFIRLNCTDAPADCAPRAPELA